VEDGEFFRECALRETCEETGLIVQGAHIEDDIFVQIKTVQGMKMYYFGVTKKWEGMPENKEPNKHADLAWFSIQDLPSPLVPHHRDAIDCIYSKKKYTEVDVTP
jgi:8-oxo-dGTP pyrophosphatase MutT (NUDIX family)